MSQNQKSSAETELEFARAELQMLKEVQREQKRHYEDIEKRLFPVLNEIDCGMHADRKERELAKNLVLRKYFRTCDAIIALANKRPRQWKAWECRLMNWLDFRFWRCECHYQAPYGRVVMAGCPAHD